VLVLRGQHHRVPRGGLLPDNHNHSRTYDDINNNARTNNHSHANNNDS
jgi:hypothetical protein